MKLEIKIFLVSFLYLLITLLFSIDVLQKKIENVIPLTQSGGVTKN